MLVPPQGVLLKLACCCCLQHCSREAGCSAFPVEFLTAKDPGASTTAHHDARGSKASPSRRRSQMRRSWVSTADGGVEESKGPDGGGHTRTLGSSMGGVVITKELQPRVDELVRHLKDLAMLHNVLKHAYVRAYFDKGHDAVIMEFSRGQLEKTVEFLFAVTDPAAGIDCMDFKTIRSVTVAPENSGCCCCCCCSWRLCCDLWFPDAGRTWTQHARSRITSCCTTPVTLSPLALVKNESLLSFHTTYRERVVPGCSCFFVSQHQIAEKRI